MKMLAAIVVSVSVWAAGCCGGGAGDVVLVPGESSAKALMAGGARAGFRVLSGGEALPKGLTLASSNPAVVDVAVQPDAMGNAVVLTGKAGEATLSLRDAAGTVRDEHAVSVREPAKLEAWFVDAETVGRAAANEVVGVRIQARDADGVALFGSGRAKISIQNGSEALGTAIEGVERLFVTGPAGRATLHVTLDGLRLDADVIFVTPVVAATHTRSVDTMEEVAIAVRDEHSAPLAGGKCAWTLKGDVALVTADAPVEAVELRTSAARVATFTVGTGTGPASATCALGGQSSTVTFR